VRPPTLAVGRPGGRSHRKTLNKPEYPSYF